MDKILIVYGSSTGNTADTASKIYDALNDEKLKVELKNVSVFNYSEITDYDLILFGCSTWGLDEIELQPDFYPFYESLSNLDLKEKKAAVFGCGDLEFRFFCGAVDMIENRLKEIGTSIIQSSLKVDGDPEKAHEEIKEWTFSIKEKIKD